MRMVADWRQRRNARWSLQAAAGRYRAAGTWTGAWLRRLCRAGMRLPVVDCSFHVLAPRQQRSHVLTLPLLAPLHGRARFNGAAVVCIRAARTELSMVVGVGAHLCRRCLGAPLDFDPERLEAALELCKLRKAVVRHGNCEGRVQGTSGWLSLRACAPHRKRCQSGSRTPERADEQAH